MTVDADTFVVGAGPAGLSAAYCLTRETPSVMVIEKDPIHVGGLARTVPHRGFRFDIGGQRSAPPTHDLSDLLHELMPDDFAAPPHRAKIFRRGKYYPYPLTPFETLKNLGAFTGAACVMSYALARAAPIAMPRTFHDRGRNQLGEFLFRTFFKAHTEKMWGLSYDDISADWATQCIRELNLRAAARRALHRSLARKQRSARGKDTDATDVDPLPQPHHHAGTLWDAAVYKIRERGGKVLMGRELRRLSYDTAANMWRIEVTAPSTIETYTARHVISSAPVRDLVNFLAVRPISYFQAQSLRYRDLVTVALMAKRPDACADHAIHIHDHSLQVARIRNLNALVGEASFDRTSCIGLEYFCFEGDQMWSASNDELVALARNEIVQIGLLTDADIVDACVVRQPKAYPIYDEDYLHHMAMIRLDFETHYPTLHLIGRNGTHRHHDQNHAMMTGLLTARNILAGKKIHDVWTVNNGPEYDVEPLMPSGEVRTPKPAHEVAA